MKPFLSSTVLVVVCCLVSYVHSGANTFPRTFHAHPPHRYISVSNQCVQRSTKEIRDTALEAFQELHKIQRRFDRAVIANDRQPSIGISQPFVASYSKVEDDFIEELVEFFNLNTKKLIKVIHNYGVGAEGDYLCAFELYGEVVGDNIDFYEYNVKNLRHDLIGVPNIEGICEVQPTAYESGNATVAVIREALDKALATSVSNQYDHFAMAYNFVESFEKAMWAYSDQLEVIYDLDSDIWRQTLVYNGHDAPIRYLCAYYNYFLAENAHAEAYLDLIMDVIQRTKEFKAVEHTTAHP